MAIIQITIQRVAKGAEMAKTYNTAFEGDLTDLKQVQTDIDASVERILWDKGGIKEEKRSII